MIRVGFIIVFLFVLLFILVLVPYGIIDPATLGGPIVPGGGK